MHENDTKNHLKPVNKNGNYMGNDTKYVIANRSANLNERTVDSNHSQNQKSNWQNPRQVNFSIPLTKILNILMKISMVILPIVIITLPIPEEVIGVIKIIEEESIIILIMLEIVLAIILKILMLKEIIVRT